MEEKKRIAKGIKLNASQLPLTNKADFVIGKDSRKVLDNKIIENLGGGSHGYFPSSFGNEYKTWSVSRELEIPVLPADADEQMKMIEGATSREPLQNEFSAGYADPFFTGNATPESDPFFINEAMSAQVSEPPASPVTPAQDPSFAPNLADTCRETLPKGMSWTTQPVDDAPSPWGAPSGGTQERYVVTSGNSQIEQQAPSESPWAGPPEVTAVPTSQPQAAKSYEESPGPQPEAAYQPEATCTQPEIAYQPESTYTQPEAMDYQSGAANSQPEAPETAVDLSAPTNPERASDDADMLPDWMNTLVFDATVSSELQSVESDETIEGESTEHVELEKFLSSIPDEEFVIDNETMRHLFSSLCEPKATTKKIKSAASEAADLAIAAAAADILKSEVSIDEISIDDLSTREMREKSQNPGAAESEAAALAEFEAIQKAYAMLDLTPLSSSQRKESFGNVYDVVENAAEQVNANQHEVVQAEPGSVARTERGTIEMATHAGGRQLIPTYNQCGMLTGVAMSDGLSFILSEEKNIWHMIEQSGKVMVSGIQSVSFDKHGNLSYVTKRGDTVTLKIDGSVDTKFAKKTKGMSVEEGDKAALADDANVAEAKEVSEISRDTESVVQVDSFDGTSDSAPDSMTEKGSEVPAKAARPGAKSKSEKKSEKEPAKGPAKEPVKEREIESRPAPKAQSKPAAKSKPQADTKAAKPAKKPKPKKKGR